MTGPDERPGGRGRPPRAGRAPSPRRRRPTGRGDGAAGRVLRRALVPGRPAIGPPAAALLVMLLVLVAVPAPPAQGASVGLPLTGAITGVHDPMLVKDGQTYRLFSTGGGIHVRTSTDLRAWTTGTDVFPTGLPAWVATQVPGVSEAWAPDVSWWGGQWHLYYAVSVFGTADSAIGHATSPVLDPEDPAYHWADHGPVVVSHESTAEANAIDPNVVLDEHGAPWLAWGSFRGGIVLQQLDPATGAPAPGAPVHTLATRDPWWTGIEAAFIVERGGYWYLFTSWYFCCHGTTSNYEIHVARAAVLTGPYVAADGTSAIPNGGTLLLAGDGPMRGPGHNAVLHDGGDWWLVHHWYDADAAGVPTLGIRSLTWTADGWPEVPGAVTPTTTTSTTAAAPDTTITTAVSSPPATVSATNAPPPATAIPATPRLTG